MCVCVYIYRKKEREKKKEEEEREKEKEKLIHTEKKQAHSNNLIRNFQRAVFEYLFRYKSGLLL